MTTQNAIDQTNAAIEAQITEITTEITALEAKGSTGRKLQRLKAKLYSNQQLLRSIVPVPTDAIVIADDAATPALATCGMAAPTATATEDATEVPYVDPTATPTANGAAKKDGLRKPQLKILAAIVKAGRSLTRKEIVEATKLDGAWMTEWVGSLDETKRTANDAKKFPCLLTLKLVKAEEHEEDGKKVNRYGITAAGKKALETAEKSAK